MDSSPVGACMVRHRPLFGTNESRMASLVLQEIDTYGPDRCGRLDYEQASAYAHRLVHSQYENFTVVSWLLPRRFRDDFAHIYAFCRWADDLGDETGDRDRSLELLDWWRRELDACYAGEPRHPVFVALGRTIEKLDIPAKPFHDLIDAFVQDQKIVRYETWEQTCDYCTRSADPVGRLVLYACGLRDEERQRLSDSTCTALQLVNFWQDVRRDIVERDRVYVPSEALAVEGLTHDDLVGHVNGDALLSDEKREGYKRVIKGLVDRTVPLFDRGEGLWPLLPGDVRPSIRLFSMGGRAVCRGIERIGYDTIDQRPSVGKRAKVGLLARALMGRLMGVGGAGRS